MDQVTHSPFLQALGYAIINSLWQFALLWLVYVLVNTLGKLSSHQKYLSALVLQIVGFTWFVLTSGFYYIQLSEIATNLRISGEKYPFNLTVTDLASVRQKWMIYVIKAELFLPYLSVAYLTLLAFFTLKWLQAYKQTQIVKTQGLQKIEVQWRLFARQLASQLGIKQEVKIYLSELVSTPLTIGFLKPLILIPIASINHLNVEQMECVILHELAHIKRFDYLFNLLLAVIEAALFFNPFTRLLSSQIKRERENCCDDWVLQYQYSAPLYATALLQIATCQSSSPALAMKAASDKHALLNRVKRMIEKKEKSFFNYKQQVMALFVTTAVLSILSLLSVSNKAKTVTINSKQPVVVKPIAATVDNPLFNPVFFLAKEDKEVETVNAIKQQKHPVKTAIVSQVSLTTNKAKIALEAPAPEDVREVPVFPAAPEPVMLPFNANNLTYINAIANTGADNNIDETLIAKAEKDKESAEHEIKKLAAFVLKQHRSDSFDQMQIEKEFQDAVKQLKLATIQIQLVKAKLPKMIRLKQLIRPEMEIISEPVLFNRQKVKTYLKKAEQKSEDLYEEVEEDEDNREEADINNTKAINYTFNFRNISQNVPSSGSYSYEYTEKPGNKAEAYVIRNNKGSEDGNKKSRIRIAISTDSKQLGSANAPCVRPAANHRSFYIIKI